MMKGESSIKSILGLYFAERAIDEYLKNRRIELSDLHASWTTNLDIDSLRNFSARIAKKQDRFNIVSPLSFWNAFLDDRERDNE